ncbi:hypothetical protein [Neobacillus kokaensis]|uniref:SHOCT domain-containing protein n=1 Tax=Neobacillus kokaensis TaxID=2759023 RepID=A0ABQ3MYM0_9BACI|nr:hypothetical protein [Neobacillus kokaensis]GHH96951.1 hypothetical protein AM1BK_04940 [Neobacillus kokaensis]
MLKKKWAFIFVIAFYLSNLMILKADAATAYPAEKFPIKEMQIQVMPEFDYPDDWPSRDIPALLVGEYGTIINKSGHDFDGKFEVSVPAKDKGFEAFLVAEFPEENKPEVQRPYDVDKENGIISWKPSKPIKKNESYKFVIEYYTETIDVKDIKSFTYEFKNNSDIEQLEVIYYAPMNAKQIQMEPKAHESSKNEYGENLFFYQYKNIKAGRTLKYTFSYKKDGTESSMEVMSKVQVPNDANHSGVSGSATDQITKGTSGPINNLKRPLIGIGGAFIIGIAVIIAGIFVFLGFKANSQDTAHVTRKNKYHKKRPASTKKNSKIDAAEAKKELRKKLLTGKMDQETYEEEMKKLI